MPLKHAAEPAGDLLCECLESDDELLSCHASIALGKIGPYAALALQHMMQSSAYVDNAAGRFQLLEAGCWSGLD